MSDNTVIIDVPGYAVKSINDEYGGSSHIDWDEKLSLTPDEILRIVDAAIEQVDDPEFHKTVLDRIREKVTTQSYDTEIQAVERQLLKVPHDAEGFLLLKYGTPDYQVSSSTAENLAHKLRDRLFELGYSNRLSIVLMPYYVDLSYVDTQYTKNVNKIVEVTDIEFSDMPEE